MRMKVIKEIERYNLEVMKYKGTIPSITKESLKRAFTQKPSKQMFKFQQLYAE